jgi:hypothetical protein
MKVVKAWSELDQDCLYFDHRNEPMCYGISMSFWPELEGKEVESSRYDGPYQLQMGPSAFHLDERHVKEEEK